MRACLKTSRAGPASRPRPLAPRQERSGEEKPGQDRDGDVRALAPHGTGLGRPRAPDAHLDVAHGFALQGDLDLLVLRRPSS